MVDTQEPLESEVNPMKARSTGRTIRALNAPIVAACLAFMAGFLLANVAQAATAKEIDVSVDVALERFHKEVKGGKEFLQSAKGVLVFPKVIKAGFGIGGEYGEGALRIGGKTVDYYNTAAASIGFQLGAQSKTVILVFMQQEALKDFRASSGWEVGVDGSVALITLGAGGSIDTTSIKAPIVGFVIGQKGLMFNLTLEGSKFTKLKK
jgi:lipid-binding SYLF domain-containing protein